MSDLFGAPPAPAPAPPPARRARAPRAKAPPAPAAAAPQESRPTEELQATQVVQAEPPIRQPPRLYGLVTLHDGRQVDSASEEWRRETLARHLLTLAPPERDDWLAGWPADAAVEMRLLIGALRATDRGGR